MPGDTHKDLRANVTLHEEVSELVLLPVWVFAVRHSEDEPPVQILVNGQSGRVAGKVPHSAARIAAAVLVGLAIVAAIVLLVAGGLG